MSEENTYDIEMVSDDFLLDDIEDLPSYSVFPSGAYVIRLEKGIEDKEINDKKYYETQLTMVSVVELSEKLDATEAPPKPGDIGSMLFDRTNKLGMGSFKEFVKDIAIKSKARTIAEVKAAAKGMELMIVVRRVPSKKEEGRYNMRIKTAMVV